MPYLEKSQENTDLSGKGNRNQRTNMRQHFLNLISSWRGLSRASQLKIKLGISILMFGSLFILGKVDLSKSLQAASAADYRLLVLAAVIFMLTNFLNAYRWQLLAAAVGFSVPLIRLVQYYFIGLFFNLFLPSTVGGDASRCYYLAKGTHRYKYAFYSVFVDRTMGIAVLFLFASCGLLFGPGGAGLPWPLKLPIFAGTVFVYFVLPILPFLSRTLLGRHNWIARQLNDPAIQVYWRDKNLILTSLLLSVVLQLAVVFCHILIGYALGFNQVPFWYYFIFYPSVAVLGFITPSFNGIGVREWAYTYFLSLAHVDRSLSLTYALIWLGLISLTNLVGGIVYLAGHFHFSAKEAEAVQEELEDELNERVETPLPNEAV